MIKIFKEKQLKVLDAYQKELVEVIIEAVKILDENYGVHRNIDDLGGYIVLVESVSDIETLKKEKLEGIIPEYTDIIQCKGGVNWTSSLFLLSSDYSVIVVTTEELSKLLVEQEE